MFDRKRLLETVKKNRNGQKIIIIGAAAASLVGSGGGGTSGGLDDGFTHGNLDGKSSSGDDIISVLSGAGIIDGGSGDDIITGHDSADFLRGGAGKDIIKAGGGKDYIAVIGVVNNGTYSNEDLANPNGTGVDLRVMLTLADVNDNPVSDVVAGEIIDGGADGAILFVFGQVDFTGVTLLNITRMDVHSEVTISATQLKALIDSGSFEQFIGDGTSKLIITNDGGSVELDFSGVEMKDISSIDIATNVTLLIDQADLGGLTAISGGGSVKPVAGLLNFTGIQVDANIQVLEADDEAAPKLYVMNDFARGGAEFLVNSQTDGNQTTVSVSGLKNGGYVLTWLDGDTNDTRQADALKMQIYNENGSKNGGEMTIISEATDDVGLHDVVVLENGNIAVVWQVTNLTSGLQTSVISGRIYTENGDAVGAEFIVDASVSGVTNTGGAQNHAGAWTPDMVALKGGGFAVTWHRHDETIWAKSFADNGSPTSVEVAISIDKGNDGDLTATIGSLDSGGYVVTWVTNDDVFNGPAHDIRGVVLTANGVVVKADFLVNNIIYSDQSTPEVTGLSNGNFVVVWYTRDAEQDNSDRNAIKAQLYSATGVEIGSEFFVKDGENGGQRNPSVIALKDGGFLVSWTSSYLYDGSGSSIRAQQFANDATAVGDTFTVDSHGAGYQGHSDVTALADGGYVVAWQTDDSSQDGDGTAIKAQAYEFAPVLKYIAAVTYDFDIVTGVNSAHSGGVLGDVTISGLPNGVSFNHGTMSGGSVVLSQADLVGLKIIIAPTHVNGSGELTISMSATGGGQSHTANIKVPISIGNWIMGDGANNIFPDSDGVDHVYGGGGGDTFVFNGALSEYSFSIKGNDIEAIRAGYGGAETDLLHSIENFQFGVGPVIDLATFDDLGLVTSLSGEDFDAWLAASYDYTI